MNDFVFVKKIIKVCSLCNGLIDNVNIVSGEAFLPDDTKPLPEPMLTTFYDAIWIHCSYNELIWFWESLYQNGTFLNNFFTRF